MTPYSPLRSSAISYNHRFHLQDRISPGRYPEEESEIFLRNVGSHKSYTAAHPILHSFIEACVERRFASRLASAVVQVSLVPLLLPRAHASPARAATWRYKTLRQMAGRDAQIVNHVSLRCDHLQDAGLCCGIKCLIKERIHPLPPPLVAVMHAWVMQGMFSHVPSLISNTSWL
jgi:hypothetical protein